MQPTTSPNRQQSREVNVAFFKNQVFSFLERKFYAEDTFCLGQYYGFEPLSSTKQSLALSKGKKKKKKYSKGSVEVLAFRV